MGKIVAVANQKGGVGKTNISINVAHCFNISGEKTILIDADPQGSARDWHSIGNADVLNVLGMDRPTLVKDIEIIKSDYDWIFIDCPPRLKQYALDCADIILIPIQPSPYDIWATQELIELIKLRIKASMGKLKVAFIVSRQITNTTIGNEFRSVLESFELPIFKNGTFQRIIYSATASVGTSVCVGSDPSNPAHGEIYNISQELKEFSI